MAPPSDWLRPCSYYASPRPGPRRTSTPTPALSQLPIIPSMPCLGTTTGNSSQHLGLGSVSQSSSYSWRRAGYHYTSFCRFASVLGQRILRLLGSSNSSQLTSYPHRRPVTLLPLTNSDKKKSIFTGVSLSLRVSA